MRLEIIADHVNFVRLNGGFALHDGQSLHQTIFATAPDAAPLGRDTLVLYFEDENLAQAFARNSPDRDPSMGPKRVPFLRPGPPHHRNW